MSTREMFSKQQLDYGPCFESEDVSFQTNLQEYNFAILVVEHSIYIGRGPRGPGNTAYHFDERN